MDRHGDGVWTRPALVVLVSVCVVLTATGVGIVSASTAGATNSVDASSTQTTASIRGGTSVSRLVRPTSGVPAGAIDSASCSFSQTDSNLARDGSTAGVLDPRTDDRIPVLLGGFTDTSPTYTPSDFEDAFFGTGTGNVSGPGTLRDYYLEMSGGMINLSAGPAGVNGWYETDMKSDRILESDGDFLDLTPRENSQFVRKVIEQADSDVDFSAYDNDGDGCIAVVVVYQDVPIRAHSSSPWGNFFKDADFNVDVDGVTVSAYARVQEEHTNGGNKTGNRETVGTPAHEIGHLYGLPDLYKEDGGPNDDIGVWGLMAAGNYGRRPGELLGSSPVHPTAWTKLQLLRDSAPGDGARTKMRTIIPGSGRPGILPPATENEFYRINPPTVDGCSACDGQYYLLAYRKQVGFDAGLQVNLKNVTTIGPNDALRISRINGPWDGDMDNDPNLIEGVARLNAFGNSSFNASTSPLARLADGSDSGIDLRNFSEQYGAATFNDPPERHLDADETAVYAIAVSQTLPDGTRTGDDWMVDHRVAIKGTANMTIRLSSGGGGYFGSNAARTKIAQGQDFLQVKKTQRGLSDGVVSEGAKVIHTTNQSTDYISATTYPTFPLPSAIDVTVTEPWNNFEGDTSTITATVNVTAAGEPYDYGQWGSPDTSQFGVTIGGVEVSDANLTVTERDEHLYEVEAVVPVGKMNGYDVNVSFTGEKAGVEHTVSDTENIIEPVLTAMSGDGSASSPYEITKLTQLQAVDAAREAHFELTSDLDGSVADDWFGGKGFTPIGDAGEFPDGVNVTLEGNGHTISGLTIERPNQYSVGLFSAIGPDGVVRDLTIDGATIRGDGSGGGSVGTLAAHNRGLIENVTVRNADVREMSQYSGEAGGLVGVNGHTPRGESPEQGTIRGAAVSGTVTSDGQTGGIAGINGRGGTVVGSHSSATIDGGRRTGGLVGESMGPISRSYATGEVSGEMYTGGLVGQSIRNITRSYATGSVSGAAETGGLVGELSTDSYLPIANVTESFATGDVRGSRKVGGLVGVNDYGIVSKSYARGDVTGEIRVAGLVGVNNRVTDGGLVRESYATGNVTGDRFTAGLAYNGPGGVISASYWSETTVTGEVDQRYEDRVLTPEQMQGDTAPDRMSDFDFQTTWTTVDGDYPQLQWYATAESGDDPSNDSDQQTNETDGGDGNRNTSDGSSGGSGGSGGDGNDQGSGGFTPGGSGPGLGITAAVVSLLVATCLLARRD